MQGQMWTKHYFIVSIKYAKLRVRKKMEQNFLDSPGLVIIFLRAKIAGTAVLHMLFWTLDISFNIDSELMNMENKKVYFLVKNWHSSLDGLY